MCGELQIFHPFLRKLLDKYGVDFFNHFETWQAGLPSIMKL